MFVYTTSLSSLTSSTLTAAALDSVMTSVLDDHAPATRRKASAGCDPWFSTVAEQARTAKRHKRQMERQLKKKHRKQEPLLSVVKRRKLTWFGHVNRHDSLAKTILQGTVEGGRRRG
ncbi:hypothetical protein ACOMHN_056737 [Nucella lapillus]